MCLVSIWLAGSLAMVFVAIQNFYTIDRLLEERYNESFNATVEELGPDRARELLRYLSSELNRQYFQWWNLSQLLIAVGTLILVYPVHSTKIRWAILIMLFLVLFMTALITPQIITIGRGLDFIPRNPPPPELGTFGLLHAAYSLIDTIKTLLAGAVLICLHKEDFKDNSFLQRH